MVVLFYLLYYYTLFKIYEESNKCAQIIFSDMKKAGFKVNNIHERGDLTGFNWSEVLAETQKKILKINDY